MKTLPPFQTFGAALDEAQNLAKCGWEVTPADLPDVAEVGFLATKQFPGGWYRRRLVWRPYGYLLTPEVALVEKEDDFYDLFRTHFPHRMFKCDDLKEDLLGFVCYCKQRERRSTVFRFPADFAQHMGPVFLDARDAAQGENLRILLADA